MALKQMEKMTAIHDRENMGFCFLVYEQKIIAYLCRRPGEETYTLYTTPLRGKEICAGRLKDGRVVVFASDGTHLLYMTQERPGYPEFRGPKAYHIGEDDTEIRKVVTCSNGDGIHLGMVISREGKENQVFLYSIWENDEAGIKMMDDTEKDGTYSVCNRGNSVDLYYIGDSRVKLYASESSGGKVTYFWMAFNYQYPGAKAKVEQLVNSHFLGVCGLDPEGNTIVLISLDYKNNKYNLLLESAEINHATFDMTYYERITYTLSVTKERELIYNRMEGGKPDYHFKPVQGGTKADTVTLFQYWTDKPRALALDREKQILYQLVFAQADKKWEMKQCTW